MKSAKFTTALLKFLFLNEELKLGDSLYLSLHKANPVGGTQATHEVNYPGYKRVKVKRDTSGWEVLENAAALLSVVSFPQVNDKVDMEATYLGIGVSETGEGMLLYVGQCADEPFYIYRGSTPQVTPATTIVEG